jgi:hypothetical protein
MSKPSSRGSGESSSSERLAFSGLTERVMFGLGSDGTTVSLVRSLDEIVREHYYRDSPSKKENAMPPTNGFNHVALVTADLDRLISFYRQMFEAPVLVDLDEGHDTRLSTWGVVRASTPS